MQSKHGAFTLLELMIVMTIIFIMSVMVFAPYAYYINKAKVKFTNKEITQAIYEAKNKAVNGSTTATGNVSMGVYFDTSIAENDAYSLVTFPHDISMSVVDISSAESIQKRYFQTGIQMDSFDGLNRGMIFFRSISGSGVVLGGDSTLSQLSNNEIKLEYSHKGSSNIGLQGSIKYFQDTQIVDY